jgi:hypothetical protein
MKRIIAIAIFALTGILSVGKTLAQVPAVQVNVPFNFVAGDKLLPAGSYTITSPSAGIIEFRNRNQHFLIASPALPDNKESENGGELVFARYGNRYFLHEILCDYATMNVHLPRAKSEKWASTQEASVQQSGEVIVAGY